MSTLSIRIDSELKAELEARATADERSLSSYVVRLVRRHVEETRSHRADIPSPSITPRRPKK
jgi:hypothetical protein